MDHHDLFHVALGIKTKALHMLGWHSTGRAAFPALIRTSVLC